MPGHAPIAERFFGLSTLGDRRSVRPDEIVSFRFHAKNASESTTPAASLALVLPPGWSALDPLKVDWPALAPGAEREVMFRACPGIADATIAESPVQAVLYLDANAIGSNVLHMRVAGRPRLNGPASRVCVTAADGEGVHVQATLTNDGDAAALAVRLVVPPPPGFHAGEAATVAQCPELPPGASLSIDYLMTPIVPGAELVAIDDAYAAYDGGCVALARANGVHLAARLVAPQLELRRHAGRLDIRVRIANDGWVAARDLGAVIELAGGWRMVRGALCVDGAPAKLRRDRAAGVAIELPPVPARGFVELTAVAGATTALAAGEVVIRCGDHVATLPVPLPRERALRIDARPATAFAEPGSAIDVSIDVRNAGETSERITLALDGRPVWSGEMPAGSVAAVAVSHRVPADAADGDLLAIGVSASAADGVELASARIEVRALDRAWIVVEDTARAGEQLHLTLRNVGATDARDIRLDGTAEPLIARLAPGQAHTIAIDRETGWSGALTSSAGRRIPIGWGDDAPPLALKAQLYAQVAARSGERLDIRLLCTTAGPIRTLRVRSQAHAAAAYVAGSTTVNGHAVIDGAGEAPLARSEGLELHEIPAGAAVEVGWSLCAHTAGATVIAVDLRADGCTVDVAPLTLTVAPAPPFGLRPHALPFHIDAPTVGDADLMPAAARPDEHKALPAAPAGWLDLDEARSAAIVRLLRGARGPGLLSHLPALAALFPDGFDAAAPALRGIFERLFVKLRIPGYEVGAGDFEDAAARRELLDLLGRLAARAPSEVAPVRGDVWLRIDCSRAAALRSALDGAPLGAPQALAALAALLPCEGGADAGAALGAYAGLLASTLAAACALEADTFALSAAREPVPALDVARRIAIAALDARTERSAP